MGFGTLVRNSKFGIRFMAPAAPASNLQSPAPVLSLQFSALSYLEFCAFSASKRGQLIRILRNRCILVQMAESKGIHFFVFPLFSYISPDAPSFLTSIERQWLMPCGEWSDQSGVRIQESGAVKTGVRSKELGVSTASGLLSPSTTCEVPPPKSGFSILLTACRMLFTACYPLAASPARLPHTLV